MKNEKILNNSELPAFLPCLILLLCCFFGLWTKKQPCVMPSGLVSYRSIYINTLFCVGIFFDCAKRMSTRDDNEVFSNFPKVSQERTKRSFPTYTKNLSCAQKRPLLHTGKPVLAYNKVRFNPQKGLLKLRIRSTH